MATIAFLQYNILHIPVLRIGENIFFYRVKKGIGIRLLHSMLNSIGNTNFGHKLARTLPVSSKIKLIDVNDVLKDFVPNTKLQNYFDYINEWFNTFQAHNELGGISRLAAKNKTLHYEWNYLPYLPALTFFEIRKLILDGDNYKIDKKLINQSDYLTAYLLTYF